MIVDLFDIHHVHVTMIVGQIGKSGPCKEPIILQDLLPCPLRKIKLPVIDLGFRGGGGGGEDNTQKIGRRFAAHFPKPLNYLRPKSVIFSTLRFSLTLKVNTLFQTCLIISSLD